QADGLAEDVPARRLDRGDRVLVQVAAVVRHALDESFPDRGRARRVLPDRKVLQLVDRSLDRAHEAVERSFADPGQSLVRVDPREQPVLPSGADGDRLDPGDPHRVTATRLGIVAAATVMRMTIP